MKEKIAVIGSYAVGMTIVGGAFSGAGRNRAGQEFSDDSRGKRIQSGSGGCAHGGGSRLRNLYW